jgi:excisionase family DNA binding protein
MLSVKETARELGVSVGCVYQLTASGKLPSHRFGLGRGTIRVAESDLAAFMQGCRNEKRVDQPAARVVQKSQRAFKHLRLGYSPDLVEQPGVAGTAIGVDRRGQASTDQNDQAKLPLSLDQPRM